MPALKIRVGGASKEPAKPTRKSTRKPAKPAAKPAAKRGSAKPAAKRGPGRPRNDGAEPKSRRSSVAKTDDKTMTKLLAAVEKAGDRRREAEEEHKASVDALHLAAQAALDGGVPMARVSEASGISRQWLYKMGEFAGRSSNGGNGNGGEKKAAVKRTPRQSAKASTRPAPRSKSTKSTQSKSGAGTRSRPRIKSR